MGGKLLLRRAGIVAAVVLVWTLVLVPGVHAQLADSAWPMFRQNLNHTGQSPYVGALTNVYIG